MNKPVALEAEHLSPYVFGWKTWRDAALPGILRARQDFVL